MNKLLERIAHYFRSNFYCGEVEGEKVIKLSDKAKYDAGIEVPVYRAIIVLDDLKCGKNLKTMTHQQKDFNRGYKEAWEACQWIVKEFRKETYCLR